MLRKALPFILASVALSLAVTWIVAMVRMQASNGAFDRFMKKPDELPVEPVTETSEA